MPRMRLSLIATTILLSATPLIAQTTLTAQSGSPTLDGIIGEAEWTSDGLVTGNDVTLYAMADGEFLYLAAHWQDSTENINKRRWQFDGSTWARGPEDEDRIAFIWDMGVNGDDGPACLTMCHGDAMHTNVGNVDVWHWKASRGNAAGFVDDKYWDPSDRHSDPGTSAYIENNTEAGGPAFMASSDPGANVTWLAADADALAAFDPFGTMAAHTVAEAVPYDSNAVFEAGDTIPWYLMRPSDGDRGSVESAGKWDDGWWTVEFRKPYAGGPAGKTLSEFDFDVVPGTTIDFTHEIFDNRGDDHADDGFDGTVYTLDLSGLVSTRAQPVAGGIPRSFKLRQNYPNPFNPSTRIEFEVARAGRVNLSVYDLLGKRVETLVDSEYPAGTYWTTYNAGDTPSGIYFYRLESSDFTATRTMAVLK